MSSHLDKGGLTACLALVALATAMAIPAGAAAQFSATATQEGLSDLYFVRCGPGWTGGDSSYSVALPNNKTGWLFSDTFIGRVAPDGTRTGSSSFFVQGNSFLVQDLATGAPSTYLGRTVGSSTTTQILPSFAAYPYDTTNCPSSSYTVASGSKARYRPAAGSCAVATNACYYWAGGMVVDANNNLRTFLQTMEQTGSGTFDFAWRGSAIASLPTSNLTANPSFTKVTNNGVSYGGAVLTGMTIGSTPYTYIYGVREEPSTNATCTGRCVHVARVPTANLTSMSNWRHWTRTVSNNGTVTYGWRQNSAATSWPMAGAIGAASAPRTQDQLGVVKMTNCGILATCYLLVAHEYTGGFTTKIQAWYSPNPEGPWTGPTHVYTPPEGSAPGQLFTYNAKIHPQFTTADGILVSYDVNTMAPIGDPNSAFTTAAHYRPRFVRVKFSW